MPYVSFFGNDARDPMAKPRLGDATINQRETADPIGNIRGAGEKKERSRWNGPANREVMAAR